MNRAQIHMKNFPDYAMTKKSTLGVYELFAGCVMRILFITLLTYKKVCIYYYAYLLLD